MKGSWSKLWIFAAAALLLALMLMETDGGGTASQQEQRIAEVLSTMAGAGRVEVALFYAKQETGAFSASGDTPTGALVVAEGAGDMAVRLNLIRAVRTLLGLSENAVDVFVMEETP